MELTIAQLIKQLTAATYENMLTGVEFFKDVSDYPTDFLQEGAIYTGVNFNKRERSLFKDKVFQLGYVNGLGSGNSVEQVAFDDMPTMLEQIPLDQQNQVVWSFDTDKMDSWEMTKLGTYLTEVNIFLSDIWLIDGNTNKRLTVIDTEQQEAISRAFFKVAPPLADVAKQWQREWLAAAVAAVGT